MDKLKRIAGMVALCIFSFAANARQTPSDEGFMTSDGKIYVVVAVVVTIVIGLFLYLLNLDRKISKIEKKN